MKKLMCMILAFVMVLGLCACAGSGNTEGEGQSQEGGQTTGLQVGFAKINITPDYSVGLGGYSDAETRRSEGFIDYIYITCIAVSEGQETILLYTLDNCAADKNVADQIRAMAFNGTGIAEDKIFVGATHSHSCPSLSVSSSDTAGAKYFQQVKDAAQEAAEKAVADLAPAQLLAATHEVEMMNFIRHYEMFDGTYAGSNFGDFSKEIVGHAHETDPRMILVKFDREEKQDVLLVNWQAHPDHGTENGRTNISADFPGALRDKLSAESGCLVAYFTGASGDQNAVSKIPEENPGLGMKEYGQKMAEHALEGLAKLAPVEGTAIKTHRVMWEAEIDHSWDHLLNEAKTVYDLWKTAGKSAGDALGKTYNFTSSYQARAIISRAGMAATRELELNSFSIGNLAFITGTMEMFSTTAKYVRANSPYDITFIMTGCSGYIPNAEAYDYRSYEADTGYFAKGTAEKLSEQYVQMLKDLG